MATLFSGQSLLPGQSLQSDNGLYTLTMQSDGNVVLYNNVQKPLWWTNTGGGLIDPRDFIMQTDGNLVLYDTSGQARWNSKTQGNPGAFLNVQDDGNLVVYRAGSATETVSNALWSAGTNVPPPLSLRSVVDSGPMLNVGNADLFSITAGMISNKQAGQFGIGWSNTEQGSWSEVGPVGCGGHPVTVNVRIDATWDSGPGWNGQDLRDAFAGALWAVMQGVGTSYENYSYTELPAINGDAVLCVDPQFLDWGHHIPAAIRITAHDNNTGDTANEVTVRYSTQDQSGGDVCGTIKDLAGGLLPLFLEDAPAAIVGTAMTVICDLIDG